ncbi:DUF624 domain-containing protein [Clostridium swellfunianum]|uniref:YesL family protein n=1 Tax=Clostridium swellfunianum TaxID=1367462 RepID=UPI00202E38A3|nr:DUF624 domain-containing protein [Clostridium swellfunianum]MCM0647310.1 DUF624 domain-containing protein [Clostridium swellfunianum]
MNLNGSFYKYWSFISDIIILNLLWLAVTLIGAGITFGAATSACYAVMSKIVNKKNYSVFKDFFSEFKRNFKQATIVWLILGSLGALSAYNYSLAVNTGSFLVTVIFYASVFQLIIISLYVFMVIAAFEGSITTYIINSLIIANRHIPSTILIISSLIGTIFLTFYVSSFLNLIVWGIFFLSSSYWAKGILEGYKKSIA